MAELHKNELTAKRRSQRLKDAREKHLSTKNDPFWIKEEHTLLLAFSRLRVHELLRCATTSKAWRKCIDENAIAWITAMWELDPLAVLGPKGTKAAVARLKEEGVGADTEIKGKYWLVLAERLASPSCTGDDGMCPVRGFELNPLTLSRLCVECRADLHSFDPEEADGYETLINKFMFDKEPSVQVSTPSELLDAMESLHEGGCIEVSGTLRLTKDDAEKLMVRAVYDPAHYRYRFVGANAQATIISRDCTLLFGDCMIQDLNITVGSNYLDYECCGCAMCNRGWGCFCWNEETNGCSCYEDNGYADTVFPALQVEAGNNLLLKDCVLRSFKGTALMVTATGGSLAVDGCTLSSGGGCLGVVLQPGSGGGKLSCTDCLFRNNMWGCDIPPDTDQKVVASFIAANQFNDNASSDISRMYDHKNAVVQPWRRGWATES